MSLMGLVLGVGYQALFVRFCCVFGGFLAGGRAAWASLEACAPGSSCVPSALGMALGRGLAAVPWTAQAMKPRMPKRSAACSDSPAGSTIVRMFSSMECALCFLYRLCAFDSSLPAGLAGLPGGVSDLFCWVWRWSGIGALDTVWRGVMERIADRPPLSQEKRGLGLDWREVPDLKIQTWGTRPVSPSRRQADLALRKFCL
jgi:hypothetical protein